jgi:hypothetical protein
MAVAVALARVAQWQWLNGSGSMAVTEWQSGYSGSMAEWQCHSGRVATVAQWQWQCHSVTLAVALTMAEWHSGSGSGSGCGTDVDDVLPLLVKLGRSRKTHRHKGTGFAQNLKMTQNDTKSGKNEAK